MNISIGGYLLTQTILLVLSYGYHIVMPSWVVWFPSIIIGGILGIVLLVLLIIAIASVLE